MGLTRRRAMAALAATPVLAQNHAAKNAAPPLSPVPPQGVPAPPSQVQSGEARLQKAMADIKQASESLTKLSVPQDLEPAFSFSALK